MTIGEVVRAIESNNRIERLNAKEKATYDYILATLITKGVAISLGSKEQFPNIREVYSGIFEEETQAEKEKIEERQTQLSVLRFKQFAHSFNNNLKNKEVLTKNE